MPEVKTGPYELMIRWSCEKGETFGYVRGVHRVMQTCLVNDDGIIAMRDGETAKDFPRDQIASVFGEQFATFLSQLEGERATHAETKKKHNDILSALGDAQSKINDHALALSELQAKYQALKKAHSLAIDELQKYDGTVRAGSLS